MSVELKLAYDSENEVRELLKEYTDNILLQGDEVRQTLFTQNIKEELICPAKKYQYPAGRLYLARVNGETAGCVALRKIDATYCEMKRLYVRPDYRGAGISKLLVEQLIQDAREIGYQYMRLDTFPFMTTAIKIYKKYGFYEIKPYNDTPASNAIFMELKLKPDDEQ